MKTASPSPSDIASDITLEHKHSLRRQVPGGRRERIYLAIAITCLVVAIVAAAPIFVR